MKSLLNLLVLSLVATSTVAAPAQSSDDRVDQVAAHSVDEKTADKAARLFEKFRDAARRVSDDKAKSSPREDTSLEAHMNLKRDGANSSAAPATEPSSASQGTATTGSEPTNSSSAESEPTTSEGPPPPPSSTQESTSKEPVPTHESTTAQDSTTAHESTTAQDSTTSSSSSSSSENAPASTTAHHSTTADSTKTTKTSHSTGPSTAAPTTTTSSSETTSSTSSEETPYTSTFKSTTTLPNGEQSTVTAVTVVHPTQNRAAATTGPAPGLQTDDSAAGRVDFRPEMFFMGAAAVAMVL